MKLTARRLQSAHQRDRAPEPKSYRIHGFDGLRAFAVIAVVFYHLWPTNLPGGFIGVDVFFVLSGYLITRSFWGRPDETAGMRLARFWRNRARRILPALLPVVAVTAVAAGLIGQNVLPGLWAGVFGALTFSSNWLAIVQANSYFAETTAHPLQHLWSLAVEEQFYLLWPLLLLLFGLANRLTQRWFPIAIAAVSAVAMAVTYTPGTDPTPVYVGTGTHIFGLALGAGLALRSNRLDDSSRKLQERRLVAATVGAAALTVLILFAFNLSDDHTFTYRGGLVAVSVATTALIWSLTRGVPGIGRLLDVAPFAALGRRSYAVYLWHWPTFILLNAACSPVTAFGDMIVRGLTIVLTVLMAMASWKWIERPIIISGWTATLKSIAGTKTRGRYAVILTSALLTLGTGVACFASTRPSDAEQFITAGQDYLKNSNNMPQPSSAATSQGPTGLGGPNQTPEPGRSDTPERGDSVENQTKPSQTAAAKPGQPSTQAPAMPTSAALPAERPTADTPAPTPAPAETAMTAVGDSVMVAASPTLQASFPAVTIDAKVSRQPWDVAAILRADAASDELADTVLVGIGTNGALGDALPNIRDAIGPDRDLILVTAHGDRPWIPGVNDAIRSYAATEPRTYVADWDSAISNHENLLAADGIHPGTAGGQLYADAVTEAMSKRKDE